MFTTEQDKHLNRECAIALSGVLRKVSVRMWIEMLGRLFRGLRRLRITAPLAVFEERLPSEGGLKHLQQYLRERDHREQQAIREFLARVKSDRELDAILRFYGAGEEHVREAIALLIQCAVPVRDGIAVPFVLEECLRVLATTERSGLSDHTRAVISKTFRIPAFINEDQKHRFLKIAQTI